MNLKVHPFLFLFCNLFESLRELVGAGGGFVATFDSGQAVDHLFGLQPFHEGGYPLEISVASSGEADIGNHFLAIFLYSVYFNKF